MHKVLVVDDDKALTRAIAVRLQAAGFSVEIRHNAYEASEAAIHGRPHVIILDVDLPNYTGPEFHQCLQFTGRAKHIPVIYLSGHDTQTNRRVAAEQGAAAFITKPYDADELIRILRSIIKASRLSA